MAARQESIVCDYVVGYITNPSDSREKDATHPSHSFRDDAATQQPLIQAGSGAQHWYTNALNHTQLIATLA